MKAQGESDSFLRPHCTPRSWEQPRSAHSPCSFSDSSRVDCPYDCAKILERAEAVPTLSSRCHISALLIRYQGIGYPPNNHGSCQESLDFGGLLSLCFLRLTWNEQTSLADGAPWPSPSSRSSTRSTPRRNSLHEARRLSRWAAFWPYLQRGPWEAMGIAGATPARLILERISSDLGASFRKCWSFCLFVDLLFSLI